MRASFEVINALADSYTPSADRLSHKVTLRSDIKFHDGSPSTPGGRRQPERGHQSERPTGGFRSLRAITTFFGGFRGNFK
jgi:hypothetical protein